MRKITAVFESHLTAAEVTAEESREIYGLLLPFGEIGYTSAGPVTATRDSVIDVADAPIILDIEHDPRQLIGRSTEISIDGTGVWARFQIARTRAGDDALEEIRAGLRSCLSIELDDVEIEDRTIMAGRLSGAGLVLRPAFASARLAASEPDPAESEEETIEEETTTEAAPAEDNDKEEDQDMNVTGSPVLEAGNKTTNIADLTAAFIAAQSGPAMKAALSDIIPANWSGRDLPEYVGELWSGKNFERRVIPRFAHKDLTSRKVAGWKWTTRPEVDDYSGNKAAIPSNEIATTPVEIDATRIAGGHDIDRIFIDFDSPEFWSAYWAAMTESYARKSDANVLTAIADAATEVEMGEVPDGIAPGLVAVVDGILAILNETDSLPDTAFLAPDLWRAIMLTPHDSRLAYLDAALGFEEGTLAERRFSLVPEARLDPGAALVTSRDAVTVHEFGGGAPIRVQALDIANGGVDAAIFGYLAVNIHDATGLALVTSGEAAA